MKLKLHWQILISLFLAVLMAMVFRYTDTADSSFVTGLLGICSFLAKLFMNGLRMIVVPLVASSIVCGVMGLGSGDHFGRMASKTVLFYISTTFLAVLLGLLMINLIQPGNVDLQTAQQIVGRAATEEGIVNKLGTYETSDMLSIFLQMVPSNVIKAASENGQLLGVIIFSLLFGFFVSRVPEEQRKYQRGFWESIQSVMMSITDLVLLFAPIGVFALVMPVVMRTGLDLLGPLWSFFLTVLLSLAIFMIVVMGLILRYVGKVNPWTHLKTMAPVLLTAFSTASSASTLPVTIETVEQESKVSNKTASFLLPLGATVNMAGTALYECSVVLFIAQIYGVIEGTPLSLGMQAFIVVLSVMTSIGVAGVPAASLVAITVILGIVGLPIEAVGIVWVTDRILDMLRTMVNVYGDTCGAIVIARSEGERTAYPIK